MLSKSILILFGFLFPLGGNAQPKSMIVEVGLLFNSESRQFMKNQVIWIEGDHIKAVGPSIKAPPGAQVIKLTSGTVTPGLIDAHTHLLTNQKLPENLAVDAMTNSPSRRVLRAASYARAYLNAGFTAIRDVGNSGYYLDMELASAIRRGYVIGPEMFGSGPILSAMDGQFYQLPYEERERITQKEYRVVSGVPDAILAVNA
jgi:imidazolonepropionase-like amidohydrolase